MENRISVNIPEEMLQQLDSLLTSMEQLLNDRLISLTAKENHRYGKLGHETENFAHMVHADTALATDMIPPFINREEWDKDMATRKALNPRITRLKSITDRIESTNRIIGFDIYRTSLAVYNNAKMLSRLNVNGAGTYYEKWSVQFPYRRKKTKEAQEG